MEFSILSWNVSERIALLHRGGGIASRSSSIDILAATAVFASWLSLTTRV
jgi:hypothetical protein